MGRLSGEKKKKKKEGSWTHLPHGFPSSHSDQREKVNRGGFPPSPTTVRVRNAPSVWRRERIRPGALNPEEVETNCWLLELHGRDDYSLEIFCNNRRERIVAAHDTEHGSVRFGSCAVWQQQKERLSQIHGCLKKKKKKHSMVRSKPSQALSGWGRGLGSKCGVKNPGNKAKGLVT